MLLFGMILLMNSSNKFNIAEFIKKPQVIIGGVVLLLIIVLMLVFGRGGGQDPTALSIKNLSNRHAATIEFIDKYSNDVRSANLISNASQVTIILTADKSEIDDYYSEVYKGTKPIKATFKAKPRAEIIKKLDESSILNNLDSDLQKTIESELLAIQSDMQKIKKNNPDKKKLNTLMDKLILNTQTMRTRVGEPL